MMIHGEPPFELTLADLCVHYQIPITHLAWVVVGRQKALIPRPQYKINHNIIA